MNCEALRRMQYKLLRQLNEKFYNLEQMVLTRRIVLRTGPTYFTEEQIGLHLVAGYGNGGKSH